MISCPATRCWSLLQEQEHNKASGIIKRLTFGWQNLSVSWHLSSIQSRTHPSWAIFLGPLLATSTKHYHLFWRSTISTKVRCRLSLKQRTGIKLTSPYGMFLKFGGVRGGCFATQRIHWVIEGLMEGPYWGCVGVTLRSIHIHLQMVWIKSLAQTNLKLEALWTPLHESSSYKTTCFTSVTWPH